MMFENRDEAAARLLDRLQTYKDHNPLILALPRGAVPMGRIIADGLHGELGVVLTRKLSIPGHEEYAIGAVSESGIIYKNPQVDPFRIPERAFQESLRKQIQVMKERRKKYRLDEMPTRIEGRIVIVVDDGIATGSTLMAAIQEVRSHHPAKLVVAAAVAPPDVAQKISQKVDELVLLDQPLDFYAVGQYFADFGEVTDQDVRDILWATAPVAHDRWKDDEPEQHHP